MIVWQVVLALRWVVPAVLAMTAVRRSPWPAKKETNPLPVLPNCTIYSLRLVTRRWPAMLLSEILLNGEPAGLDSLLGCLLLLERPLNLLKLRTRPTIVSPLVRQGSE